MLDYGWKEIYKALKGGEFMALSCTPLAIRGTSGKYKESRVECKMRIKKVFEKVKSIISTFLKL